MTRAILHSDLNSFYASVETMLNPALRGKAVAVCGSTEDRHGIVLAKSELAKKAGVKTGMVNWEAKRCCPNLIMVAPQYEQYLKYSKLTRAIYQRYTDLVEPFGMDECWLDVSGSQHIYGDGLAMGVKQKQGRYVNCVLYGYKRSPSEKHQMVIDEMTAPVVRRVFMDIISGKSTTEIAKSLNDEHIPTPAQYKGIQRGHTSDFEKAPRWTHNRILEMIRNIKYTGTMVNHTRESRFIRDKNQRRVPQDEWIVRENAHEAIVSPEEYQAAQDAIRKVRGYSRTSHDTSDCVFYCGHCGHKLRKTFGSDTYFSCSSAVYQENSKCSEIKFGKTEIENVVFSALKAQVSLLAVQTKCNSEKLISESFSLRKTLERLQADIDGIDREKFSRYEDYHAGEISAEAFLEEKARLNVRQSALKEELSKTQLRYDKCIHQEER